MYASIRLYRVDPDRSEELVRLVEEELAPRCEELPGFVACYLVDTGEGTLASMCIFEDRAGIKESDEVADEWSKANLEKLLAFSPKGIGAAFSLVEGTLYGRTPAPSTVRGGREPDGVSPAQAPERLEGGDGPRLLSVDEVCAMLGMGKSWVYRRIRAGEIPSIQLGKAIKVKQADLEEYLESRRRRPPGEE